jgi:DNA-binding response OmpR family regulator
MRGIDHLTAAVDDVLTDALPDSLKAAIDDALAKGASPAEVLRRVRAQAGRKSYTALGVEAYLSSKTEPKE